MISVSPFARYLKQLRLSRGYRQKALAHFLGYEPSYFSALERSEKGPPRQDFIERLIKGLNLTEQEQAELDYALRGSRRQLVLPAKASDEEYALARLLEPQLGHLLPIQVQLIELALRLPESLSSTCNTAGVARSSRDLAGKEGRPM